MAAQNIEAVEELRWKKLPVLDDGFVCLVDVMGDDAAVVQAARVSYGKDERPCETCDGEGGHAVDTGGQNPDGSFIMNWATCPDCDGTKSSEGSDRKLLRYLMRHRHSTPFEMAELKFLVRVPMDCWRQWIRHRTANVNEYSTRYSEAIDSQQTTAPDAWRLQATNNKQGSSGFLDGGNSESGNGPGAMLSIQENKFHNMARQVYQERIDAGVAREQARKDLPLSTYTEAYWKIDLHNLLHFLGLRMDSHAQQEIREYATVIGEQIVSPLFPAVWEAFQDYRLGGLFLTRLDQEMIQRVSGYQPAGTYDVFVRGVWQDITGEPADSRSRERDECIAKLERLGILPTKV